jgi:Subtilase family
MLQGDAETQHDHNHLPNRRRKPMKKVLFALLGTSVLLTCAAWPRNTGGQSSPPDDGKTLLFLLKPGADMGSVATVISGVNGTVVKSTMIQKTGQQVLRVQVPQGKPAEAQNRVNSVAEPNITAVERNYYLRLQDQENERRECPPNDPDFPQQWALPDLHFPEALCRFRGDRDDEDRNHRSDSERRGPIPTMTYLDSGVNPVYSDELTFIRQFNFASGADGVPEFPFDADTNNSEFHGTGTAGTGGATTDNHEFIAGVASTGEPVFITMLRLAAPPGTTIFTADVVDALTWCIDHQRERGGPGPINLSINAAPPSTINSSSIFQSLAQTLRAQGDLVVNGAGNSGTEDSSPEQYIRRVAGTDENNQLASFSTFGPFHAAAPATNILVLPSLVSVNGTSQSTAYWSGSIAFLIGACREKSLNAPQADKIIFNTATITNQGYHIPNLKNALATCRLQE